MRIQSIVFNKRIWTKRKAINWLNKHNYKTDADDSPNWLRFRQLPPNNRKKYISLYISDGLFFVLMS